MLNRLLAGTMILTAIVLLNGCKTLGFKDKEEEKIAKEKMEEENYQRELNKPLEAVVSIHSIVRYAENPENEIMVPDFFADTKLRVEKTPWLTSKFIEDIIPHQQVNGAIGSFDLVLTLTPEGMRIWKKISENELENGYAFLIDGVFYQSFQPKRQFRANPDRKITIEGPFDEVISAKLMKRAPFNYLKLKNAK